MCVVRFRFYKIIRRATASRRSYFAQPYRDSISTMSMCFPLTHTASVSHSCVHNRIPCSCFARGFFTMASRWLRPAWIPFLLAYWWNFSIKNAIASVYVSICAYLCSVSARTLFAYVTDFSCCSSAAPNSLKLESYWNVSALLGL